MSTTEQASFPHDGEQWTRWDIALGRIMQGCGVPKAQALLKLKAAHDAQEIRAIRINPEGSDIYDQPKSLTDDLRRFLFSELDLEYWVGQHSTARDSAARTRAPQRPQQYPDDAAHIYRCLQMIKQRDITPHAAAREIANELSGDLDEIDRTTQRLRKKIAEKLKRPGT